MSHDLDCNRSYTNNANYSYKNMCNHVCMDNISKKIRELRLKNSLTPEQFAKRIGVSRIAVLKWENGSAQNLKIANILKICDVFGMTTDELLRNEPLRSLTLQEEAAPYTVAQHWPFDFPREKINLLPASEVQAINEFIEFRFFTWQLKSQKKHSAN